MCLFQIASQRLQCMIWLLWFVTMEQLAVSALLFVPSLSDCYCINSVPQLKHWSSPTIRKDDSLCNCLRIHFPSLVHSVEILNIRVICSAFLQYCKMIPDLSKELCCTHLSKLEVWWVLFLSLSFMKWTSIHCQNLPFAKCEACLWHKCSVYIWQNWKWK